MTLGECGRNCIICLVFGFFLGLIFHSGWRIYFGESEPWYVLALVVGLPVILGIVYNVVRAWSASKEYSKLVEARRRRMNI